MPGPKPTPTATLAARGSWRASERQGEPSPARVTQVRAPSDLSPDARKVWKALAPGLIATGVLTVSDVPAFVRFCRLTAAWRAAMTTVETAPDRQNVLILGKLDEMLRKLEASLGLTPADRTGIRVDQPKTDSKSRFFGGP